MSIHEEERRAGGQPGPAWNVPCHRCSWAWASPPGPAAACVAPDGAEAVTRHSAGEAPCLNVKFDLGGEATLTAKQTRYFWTSL